MKTTLSFCVFLRLSLGFLFVCLRSSLTKENCRQCGARPREQDLFGFCAEFARPSEGNRFGGAGMCLSCAIMRVARRATELHPGTLSISHRTRPNLEQTSVGLFWPTVNTRQKRLNLKYQLDQLNTYTFIVWNQMVREDLGSHCCRDSPVHSIKAHPAFKDPWKPSCFSLYPGGIFERSTFWLKPDRLPAVFKGSLQAISDRHSI